jgi:hypothetical protein
MSNSTHYRVLIVLATLFWLLPSARAAPPRELWLYQSTNLLVDKNVDALEALWRRAAATGYTHILLADSKFARLNEMPPRYFAHVKRVKQLARALHLQIVPALFPIGYSNDLLGHDPNLAEGLPVKDQLFVVKGNVAQLQPDPPISLTGPMDFKDESISLAGRTATITANPANARFVYKLSLPPFRCYRVSVSIQTRGYTGHPEIKALAGHASLQFQSLPVKPTQDWKPYHVVFNTLDHNQLRLYFGVWGSAKGTLQWKDWKIEEVGLLNVLRRPGTPCTVRLENGAGAGAGAGAGVGAGGGRLLVEGRDYDPIADPGLGATPWPGEYDVDHAPPTLRTHHLPDGSRLRLSWYHPAIIYNGQVSACLSDPKLDELLADQAKRMKAAWGAAGYMMSHDEIRTLGWDQACQSRQLTPGQILAANARRCVNLLQGSTVYVWSDMFDPHHNAVKDYYLVRGTLAGSWEGLDPSVVIVNWNFAHRDQSLTFFADRGHRQILAGYYDQPPENIRKWLAAAAKTPHVIGIMYTTWQNQYKDLEAFARLCR